MNKNTVVYDFQVIFNLVADELRKLGVPAEYVQQVGSHGELDPDRGYIFIGSCRCIDTMQFHIRGGGYKTEDKITVSPVYHRVFVNAEGKVRHGEANPSGFDLDKVMISAGKGAAQIAKDIKRRMIEPYTPIHEKLMAKRGENAAWAKARKDGMRSLGITENFDQDRYHRLGPKINSMYFSADTCNVELNGVTYAQMRRIMEVLK